MKKIKQIFQDKKFWFFALITVLFFGTLSKLDFATDTYAVLGESGREMFKHFMSSGRFITGIFYAIFKILNIKINIVYILSFLLAIFSVTISIYKLNEIFSKDIKKPFITAIVSILIIINVFSIELFLYIEKGIMCLSILFCIIALEKLIEYFETKEKKSIWIVLIYMFLANSAYQGTVAIFVALALIYILKYSKTFKEFILNNFITAICYAIPAIINLIVVRFLANSRIVGGHDLKLSLIKITEGIENMFQTYSIIPNYVFKLMIIIILGILIYYVLKDKKKNKVLEILSIIYIFIGTIITTILPQLMQSTESIWFVSRSTYAFASLFGILFVYLLINYNVNINLEKVLVVASILYLLVQYNSFQTIIKDRYIMNYMDKCNSVQIKERIEEYENRTGEVINKIAFYQDKEIHWSYPDLKAIGDMNTRAMAPEWSRIVYLKYYLNREFEEVEQNEEIYIKYFKDKEKRHFTEDQIVIENNILNIFIY